MLSLLRLERKQTNSSNQIEFAYFSLFLTHLELKRINYTIIHSCFYPENHTRFQTKMAKVYTRFQTKTAQKPYPMGAAAHTYIAYIREYPTPGVLLQTSKVFDENVFTINNAFCRQLSRRYRKIISLFHVSRLPCRSQFTGF